jgi:hypothetical protein
MGETEGWPEESREAAQLVMDKYEKPDEATDSVLIWHKRGPWKRLVAYRNLDSHDFPAPHNGSVESFLQYSVPAEEVSELADYAHEFLAARKKVPTPYMEGLRFQANGGRDADERILSDEQLQEAVEAGKAEEGR